MKGINLKPDETKFLTQIIKGLHINVDEFFTNVLDEDGHDLLIYNWCRELFTEGLSEKEAIISIQSKRMSLYKRRMINFYTPNNAALRQSVVSKINSEQLFSELTNTQQKSILKATDKLIETNLYFEEDIVDQILHIIQNQYPRPKKKYPENGSSDSLGLSNDNKQIDLFKEHTSEVHGSMVHRTGNGATPLFLLNFLTNSL